MISIITPTFNEAKVIENTLKTLKGSLTLPHEMIICDDNSTDGTAEIAKKYADLVVTRPTNSPHVIASTRNAGARASHGEIIAFFDADFIIKNPDEFFKIALSRFESDPKLLALTGELRAWPETETVTDRFWLGLTNLSIRLQNNILHIGETVGKMMIVRRSAFEAVGGLNENLITREDGDFFKRLSKIGRTRYEPRLVIYNSWRRAHQLGWVRLMSIWMVNTLNVALFKKSISKEWKAIR